MNVSGSPTAIVLVGLPWNRIWSRTLELREFSAGRYSMGMGLPELEIILGKGKTRIMNYAGHIAEIREKRMPKIVMLE